MNKINVEIKNGEIYITSVSFLKKYWDENRFDVVAKTFEMLILEHLKIDGKDSLIESVEVKINRK